MAAIMKGIGRKTKWMGKGNSISQTRDCNTPGNGRKMNIMAGAHSTSHRTQIVHGRNMKGSLNTV